MAVAVHSESRSRESLPVCLGDGNLNRLVSLWDMLQVHAHSFVKLLIDLYAFEQGFRSGVLVHDMENFAGALLLVRKECEHFGAVSASKQLDRIDKVFEYAHSNGKRLAYDDIARLLSEFRVRVEEDLEEEVFFRSDPSTARMFFEHGKGESALRELVPKPPEQIVGVDVVQKFQSVLWDFEEAEKCLVTGRNTASVFHLMRVLEIGLGVLAKQFNPPIPSEHTNWETIINQSEKRIATMDSDPNRSATWKDDREFYSQCASHFRVFKDAWRNYTAHARGRYDAQQALEMFNNVRGFMQKLATRFHE